jgi:hypothetical protein
MATKNQFGGAGVGRVGGTAKVFFVAGGTAPCNGAGCSFNLSNASPPTRAVAGGSFAQAGLANPPAMTPTGVFTGSIGVNGTIISVGNPVTSGGVNLPFTGQGATSWGFPLTTGQLKISVTANLGPDEIFIRTGTDRRNQAGSGVVSLVTGAISERVISGPNGNRTWVTYEIPEPSAIMAASAGLFALFGCHVLVRRRSR